MEFTRDHNQLIHNFVNSTRRFEFTHLFYAMCIIVCFTCFFLEYAIKNIAFGELIFHFT